MFIGETRIVPMVLGEEVVEITETFENGALHSSVQRMIITTAPKSAIVYYGTKLKEITTETFVTPLNAEKNTITPSPSISEKIVDNDDIKISHKLVNSMKPTLSNELGVSAKLMETQQGELTNDEDKQPSHQSEMK